MKMPGMHVLAFLVMAAFINAVPSVAAFHPTEDSHTPVEDDLMGSGSETGSRITIALGAKRLRETRETAPPASDLDEAIRQLNRGILVACIIALATVMGGALLVVLGLTL